MSAGPFWRREPAGAAASRHIPKRLPGTVRGHGGEATGLLPPRAAERLGARAQKYHHGLANQHFSPLQ